MSREGTPVEGRVEYLAEWPASSASTVEKVAPVRKCACRLSATEAHAILNGKPGVADLADALDSKSSGT